MCTISCKIDNEVKDNAEAILESLGLTVSAAINMFMRAIIREEGLPISTKLKSKDQLILERVREAEDEKNLSPVFSSMEEAKEWLNA
jgi:DNA-damage-inducible protein J